jgi:hypothetical protein
MEFADALLNKIKARKKSGIIGTTLFPIETTATPTVVTLPMKDVQAAIAGPPERPGVVPAIYGATVYESIGGTVHETGFVLIANKVRVNSQPGGPPVAHFTINPTDGNVPAGQWVLTRHPGASGRTT